jgi:hypothetical protein
MYPFDKDPAADDELRQISPLLRDLRANIADENNTVPDNYFDNLADNLWAKLETEAQPPMASKLQRWYRAPLAWSAAAALVLTFALSAYFFFPNDAADRGVVANQKSDYAQLLAELDDADIEAYLLANIDDIDLSTISLSEESEAALMNTIYNNELLDEAENYQIDDEDDDY